MFVVQVDDSGKPTSVTPVESGQDGINLLLKLAAEQGVEAKESRIREHGGFYVSPDQPFDVTGCWLVENKKGS